MEDASLRGNREPSALNGKGNMDVEQRIQPIDPDAPIWASQEVSDESTKTTRKVSGSERDDPLPAFVDRLRRLADALEQGKRFEIQIADERIAVPVCAPFNIEHEHGEDEEEIELQIKWPLK